jgi:DNA adenine methylase
MQYMGSKLKIAKYLIPLLTKYRENRLYIEPFIGSGTIFSRMASPKIGNDLNKYIVSLLRSIRDGWLPPSIVTADEYNSIKVTPNNYPDYLVGFVGFGCSFGGKFFGGYAKNSRGRNYAQVSKNTLLKIAPFLQESLLCCQEYSDIDIPHNSFVYCDPPYANTTKYKNNFDSALFFDWVRKISRHSRVVVSEYNAPKDFVCIKKFSVKSTLNKNILTNCVEKLFVHKSCM